MCGMTGWVDFDLDLRTQAETLGAMTESLARRGPDASGVWLSPHAALGHRRLAVIDVDGGRQPMTYMESNQIRACLVYTGETYNFMDLRRDLEARGHLFSTKSDTEVVLHAYVEWGSNIAARLNGMYAFAVWDAGREELLLVRDRLGIKPLYYVPTNNGLVFGSEPKAIFASGVIKPAVDADGLYQLMSLVRTPGAAVFSGMKELKPGELLRCNRLGVHKQTYWQLAAREHEHDLPQTIQNVRHLLEDITQRQLTADVPLCALLSGGLDSGLITALAQRHRKAAGADSMRSFAIGFQSASFQTQALGVTGPEDVAYASSVAETIGTEHSTLLLSTDELGSQQLADATLAARDLPPFGDIDGPLYLACKQIRQHATVALSGEGADEVFGGYPWLHDPRLVAADTFPWLAVTALLGRAAVFEPRPIRGFNVADYQASRYREAIAEVPRLAGEDVGAGRMRELTYLHLTRFLPNPLDRKDRLSMANGLEIRVPYCDHRLVQYVFNVPWSMKTFDGREKSLLRAAAQGIVPQLALNRPKSPFPATTDPVYHERLRVAVSDLLAAGSAPVWSILSRPSVRALAAMPASGARIVRLGLERVLALNQWLIHYCVAVSV